MARATRRRDDGRMMERDDHEDAKPHGRRVQHDVVRELRAEIGDRDETIRLLNEALSRALEELEQTRRAA